MVSLSKALVRDLRTVVTKMTGRRRIPVVQFANDGDGGRIYRRGPDAIVEYALKDQTVENEIRLGLAAFGDFLNCDRDGVKIESTPEDGALATWTAQGVPRRSVHPPTAAEAPLERPANFHLLGDASVFNKLATACESAAEQASRYALNCIMLRGTKSDVVATDGQQLFFGARIAWPWSQDFLVPRTSFFSCKQICSGAPVEAARTEEHVVFRVGPWSLWLPIQTEARFPMVESIAQGTAYAPTRVLLDRGDMSFVARSLPSLPGGPDAPVILDVNGEVLVRSPSTDDDPPTELLLGRSKTEGTHQTVFMSRGILLRAFQLGLSRVFVGSAKSPVVATEDVECEVSSRTRLVWQPLAGRRRESDAPPIRIASNPGGTESSIPPALKVERKTDSMSKTSIAEVADVPPNGLSVKERSEDAPPTDPIAEAEGLYEKLQDAQRSARRLIVALRRQRKQERLVRATLASLRTLEAG